MVVCSKTFESTSAAAPRRRKSKSSAPSPERARQRREPIGVAALLVGAEFGNEIERGICAIREASGVLES